jgi:pimeloyl-ACP methyl ester carboxylesterase
MWRSLHAGNLMKCIVATIVVAVSFGLWQVSLGEVSERVIDIPTRPGVTQRFLYLAPEHPKAAVILFAGGHGGLEISSEGSIGWGKGNFLIRSRRQFMEQGLSVVVVDAPSDRQRQAFTGGFRYRPEHVADIKAVIAWLKQKSKVPIWLIGTSRGTQSAAFIATQLSVGEGGPDGLVLTSTILSDAKERSVLELPLEKITIPVLVVHHKQDECKNCPYRDTVFLMKKLNGVPKKELITVTGGVSQGDPCEAFAYHGFNGREKEVVDKIAEWILFK